MINQKKGYVTPGVFIQTDAEASRQKANKSVYESSSFRDACSFADIEPTKRQAVKFKNKRGLAYRFK